VENYNYQVNILDVDKTLYENFKKKLKENGVSLTGQESQLNLIRKTIFEKGLAEFNKNPKKHLKKQRRIKMIITLQDYYDYLNKVFLKKEKDKEGEE